MKILKKFSTYPSYQPKVHTNQSTWDEKKWEGWLPKDHFSEAVGGHAPRHGATEGAPRQSQSQRAGDRSPGAAGSGATDSSSRAKTRARPRPEADTGFSGDDGCFPGKPSRGRGATLKSRGKSRQNTVMVHYVALQRTTLIQSNNTVNYRINHLEK